MTLTAVKTHSHNGVSPIVNHPVSRSSTNTLSVRPLPCIFFNARTSRLFRTCVKNRLELGSLVVLSVREDAMLAFELVVAMVGFSLNVRPRFSRVHGRLRLRTFDVKPRTRDALLLRFPWNFVSGAGLEHMRGAGRDLLRRDSERYLW